MAVRVTSSINDIFRRALFPHARPRLLVSRIVSIFNRFAADRAQVIVDDRSDVWQVGSRIQLAARRVDFYCFRC